MIFRGRAFARVGFLGNPSDGYFGKTISFTLKNFKAEVLLYESPELEIQPGPRDHARFASLSKLLADIHSSGYYGGLRLIKAAVKKFCEYCSESSIEPSGRNFTLRYNTTIPRGVGLAGSSAIITAVIRALMQFYDVEIPREIQPNLILGAETEELGIPAGLQDRVVQVYEGLVYMNFDRRLMEEQGCGRYELLEKKRLPERLFVAYAVDAAQPTEKFHGDVRERFQRGDKKVLRAMRRLASIAEEGKNTLLRGDKKRLGELINANFDLRRSIYNILPRHGEMVELARKLGASCKFTGSGGAVIGIYPSESSLERLRAAYRKLGARLIRPRI